MKLFNKILIKLIDIFKFQIEQKEKKERFYNLKKIIGSYLALPLISVALIITIMVLFLLLKIYFTNSYMYALQGKYNYNWI